MWDKEVVFIEGVLLLAAFLAYILSTVFRKEEEETPEITEVLPSRVDRRKKIRIEKKKKGKFSSKLNLRVFLFLILGVVGLVIGAQLNIKSLLELSNLLNVSASFLAITAVAIGTSLPDMVVSVIAASRKKYEIALGNIFGSNVFLVLAVVGLPALIKPLAIDSLTFYVGLPFLVTATFLFIISGISRRIHIWEGLMYLLIYVLFIARLVGLI
jgi:cation:H+ antiporter